MLVTGISYGDYKRIVAEVSENYGGNVVVHPDHTILSPNRFRARHAVASSREDGARRSASGRRGPWACWHVTRDVIRGIYALNPGARVQTALITYRSAEDFEKSYRDTADHNVGSMIYPAYMPDLCDC